MADANPTAPNPFAASIEATALAEQVAYDLADVKVAAGLLEDVLNRHSLTLGPRLEAQLTMLAATIARHLDDAGERLGRLTKCIEDEWPPSVAQAQPGRSE